MVVLLTVVACGGKKDEAPPAARAALQRIPVRYVRTARHPAVEELAREGLDLEPLDLLYDSGDDLDTVYAAIATSCSITGAETPETPSTHSSRSNA